MECFDLQALPFDILILVFQFLDSPALLTACLTSKSLREIATPLLYEDVQLGPSIRCERYDLLSNNVCSFLLLAGVKCLTYKSAIRRSSIYAHGQGNALEMSGIWIRGVREIRPTL